MSIERVSLLKCEECSHVCREEDALTGRLYECTECSRKFTNEDGGGPHGTMCPDCGNKMGERVDSKAGSGSRYKKSEDALICPECNEAELEEVDGYACEFCDDVLEEDEFKDHLSNRHLDEVLDAYLDQAGVVA